MKLRIHVDQSCIDRGERDDSRLCALALAAGERLHAEVWVEEEMLWIGANGQGIAEGAYRLPEDVTYWVIEFDNGCEVFPMGFEMEVDWDGELPVHNLRLGDWS